MPEHSITPATITIAQIKHCLSLYPKVIEKHYKSKIKDHKKVPEALARDKWRYDELSPSLRPQDDNGTGTSMSLEQLERLVQWKITHGHSRPFLPAMIRKNDLMVVRGTTSGVAGKCHVQALVMANDENQITEAGGLEKMIVLTLLSLDYICSLTGVGPATGSLVMSIYDPVNMPFFEDEMFNWTCSDFGTSKLKYDKKEYVELFRQVWKLRERFGMDVPAVEIEKASFVLEHWDLVDKKDQDAMPESDDAVTETNGTVKKEAGKQVQKAAPKEQGATKRGTKRATPKPEPKLGNKEDDGVATRRSKRLKN